jgi:Zinc knuckle
LECFNCGEPGHWQAQCPLTVKAASRNEHHARLELAVARCHAGQITVEAKRRAIAAENMLWYGTACPPKLRWT